MGTIAFLVIFAIVFVIIFMRLPDKKPSVNTSNPNDPKSKLADVLNNWVLERIDMMTWNETFPKDLTSKLMLYFSHLEIIQKMIGELNLTKYLAQNLTSLLYSKHKYSPQYIKKSIEEAFNEFFEKKVFIDSLMHSEFMIDASEIYKDDKYIARYAEHIMFVVFSMKYDAEIFQDLFDSYKSFADLQNDHYKRTTTPPNT